MKKGQQKKVTKIRTKPSRKQAEEAVKTLIQWAGDNPDREGLIETPKRVVNAYKEFFGGYNSDPEQVLSKTFDLFNKVFLPFAAYSPSDKAVPDGASFLCL